MTGWDTVYAHLLTYLPTVVDTVYDGHPVTKAPGEEFAIVGDSPDGDAGSYQIEEQDVEGLQRESGFVNVRFISQSGDTELPARRATINTWISALRVHLAADRTTLREGSLMALSRVDVRQSQTPKGSVVDAVATVSYTTRL